LETPSRLQLDERLLNQLIGRNGFRRPSGQKAQTRARSSSYSQCHQDYAFRRQPTCSRCDRWQGGQSLGSNREW